MIKTFCCVLAALVYPIRCSAEDLEAGKRAYAQADYANALKELAPLAEHGNAQAQVLLGTMNLRGQGVPKDPNRAFTLYTAAAEKGNAEGQFYAGAMTFMGTAGVRHDPEQGLRWLNLAADQGSSDAQVTLGLIYLQGGPGAERNLVKADVWFHLAAERGDPLAPKQVAAVEKQMTPEDVAKAKALAAAWKPKQP